MNSETSHAARAHGPSDPPMGKDHLPRPGHHQRARDHPAFTVMRCLGRALGSGADSITVTGLTAGKAYTFTVTATVGSNSGEVVVTSSPWNSEPATLSTNGTRARNGVLDSEGVQVHAHRRRMQLSAAPPTSLLAPNTGSWSRTATTTPLEPENIRTG